MFNIRVLIAVMILVLVATLVVIAYNIRLNGHRDVETEFANGIVLTGRSFNGSTVYTGLGWSSDKCPPVVISTNKFYLDTRNINTDIVLSSLDDANQTRDQSGHAIITGFFPCSNDLSGFFRLDVMENQVLRIFVSSPNLYNSQPGDDLVKISISKHDSLALPCGLSDAKSRLGVPIRTATQPRM